MDPIHGEIGHLIGRHPRRQAGIDAHDGIGHQGTASSDKDDEDRRCRDAPADVGAVVTDEVGHRSPSAIASGVPRSGDAQQRLDTHGSLLFSQFTEPSSLVEESWVSSQSTNAQ